LNSTTAETAGISFASQSYTLNGNKTGVNTGSIVDIKMASTGQTMFSLTSATLTIKELTLRTYSTVVNNRNSPLFFYFFIRNSFTHNSSYNRCRRTFFH
jgi:hypothetical protein